MELTPEDMYNMFLGEVRKSKEDGITDSITFDVLGVLTGIQDLRTLADAELEEISKHYPHLASVYGYGDFKSMVYQLRHDELDNHVFKSEAKGKSKNKDLSKLVKVKRTVIRNGKPTIMTFYEDPNKKSNRNTLDSTSGGSGEVEDTSEPIHADVLEASDELEDDVKPLNNDVLGIYQKLGGASVEGANGSTELYNEEGEVEAVFLYKIGSGYVELVGTANGELVEEIEKRAFFQTIRKAWELGLGAIVPVSEEYAGIHVLGPYYGMVLQGKSYVVDGDTLLQMLGVLAG